MNNSPLCKQTVGSNTGQSTVEKYDVSQHGVDCSMVGYAALLLPVFSIFSFSLNLLLSASEKRSGNIRFLHVVASATDGEHDDIPEIESTDVGGRDELVDERLIVDDDVVLKQEFNTCADIMGESILLLSSRQHDESLLSADDWSFCC